MLVVTQVSALSILTGSMESKFCEYENRAMSCKRPWCEYTCPVVRYVRWISGEQTRIKYTELVYESIPEEVKREILSEALGEDVGELSARVKKWGGLDE